MASGKNIQTYFNGEWKSENTPIMKAADHGTWLGTSVFDGASAPTFTHLQHV